MRTLVLGASTNPARYSYKAIRMLRQHGHEVVAIGRDEGLVADVTIQKEFSMQNSVHTITLYLNPEKQKDYYNQILEARPSRIIFNPGTENDELLKLAGEAGIETEEACTLVMLQTSQF